MTELQSFLDTVRARLDAATSGPWAQYQQGVYSQVIGFVDGGVQYHGIQVCETDRYDDTNLSEHAAEQSLKDIELIANAPTDLARALKIIDILREALEACVGGDLASGEGIYKAEIALEAIKRADEIAGEP